jgi:ribosomal protein S18 acetylase RimI-like enzyme
MTCNGPVRVRRASPVDAAGVAHIHADVRLDLHVGSTPDAGSSGARATAREALWHDELALEPPDRAPWVALIDERLVGFASGGITRDSEAGARDGEIYEIVVDPAHRRLGIGSSLLRHVVRDLREHGFERVHVWVAEDDPTARAFMSRNAWIPDGASRSEIRCGAELDEVRYSHTLR